MTIEQVKALQWWNRLPEHVKKTLKEKYKSVDYSTGDDLLVEISDLVDIYAREEYRFPLLQEWEYTTFNPNNYTIVNVQKFINDLGSKGWELVAVSSYGTHTFKRPKQEQIP